MIGFCFCLASMLVCVLSTAPCDRIRDNLAQNGTFNKEILSPCIDPCDVTGYIVTNQSECFNQSYCHWNGTKCVLKSVKFSNTSINASTGPDLASAFLTKIGESGNDTDARNLNILGPSLPGFCPKFPQSCGIHPFRPDLQSLLSPPVNIPYCLRIPCSSNNPSLEVDGYSCHSTPGCFFDGELYNYRLFYGHSVLPGTPVCHLVIRNKKFQQLAQDHVRKSGKQWNGLFTNCLINGNRNEIFSPSPGCHVIEALKFIGVQPTMTGWIGISERNCSLIGGCFIQGRGCFNPVNPSSMNISSGSDKFRRMFPNSPTHKFGQQVCQNFDANLTADEYLAEYHRVKQSGCVVEDWVESRLLEEMLKITIRHLPRRFRTGFWYLVVTGEVGADNWMEVAEELIKIPQDYSRKFTGRYWRNFQRIYGNILGRKGKVKFSEVERKVLLHPGVVREGVEALTSSSNSSLYSHLVTCPYYNPLFPGFYPLRGLFTGCCDRNPVYIPRTKIRTQTSGVANYWGQWAPWGACSASCGVGVRSTRRRCVSFKKGGTCEGDDVIKITCTATKCPKWSEWGNWGECSASCGGGIQSRDRKCGTGRGSKDCKGSRCEKRKCKQTTCPLMGGWSQWTKCNVTCGQGHQTRSRSCDDSNVTTPCPAASSLTQSRVCNDYCGTIVEVSRTKCRRFPKCSYIVTYECRHKGGGSNKAYCRNFKKTRSKRCQPSFKCRLCRWHKNCEKVD